MQEMQLMLQRILERDLHFLHKGERTYKNWMKHFPDDPNYKETLNEIRLIKTVSEDFEQ